LKIILAQLELDLSDLEEIGSSKEINFQVEIPELKFRSKEILVPRPLDLDITVYLANESYFVSGKLQGELTLECSRCLEEFAYSIELKIEEELEKADIRNIQKVKISDLVKNNIFLAIPIKPLCSQECEGLCPECGQNLNEKQCDCDTETFDPRLADLEKFFDDEDDK
jgi:uncharacterized protein